MRATTTFILNAAQDEGKKNKNQCSGRLGARSFQVTLVALMTLNKLQISLNAFPNNSSTHYASASVLKYS